MAGGEEGRHRPAFGVSDHRCSLDSCVVEDYQGVVHPLLQGGQGMERDRIGHSGAALVEGDHPADRAQPVQIAGQSRLVPHDVDVLQPAGYEDDRVRSVAEHLIGDVARIGACIGGRRRVLTRAHEAVEVRSGSRDRLPGGCANTATRPSRSAGRGAKGGPGEPAREIDIRHRPILGAQRLSQTAPDASREGIAASTGAQMMPLTTAREGGWSDTPLWRAGTCLAGRGLGPSVFEDGHKPAWSHQYRIIRAASGPASSCQ